MEIHIVQVLNFKRVCWMVCLRVRVICVVYVIDVLTYLGACVLYMLVYLVCLRAQSTWCVYVFDVFHKIACLMCLTTEHLWTIDSDCEVMYSMDGTKLLKLLLQSLFLFFSFQSGFFSTNIQDLQDSRGRGRIFFNFLPLSPASQTLRH